MGTMDFLKDIKGKVIDAATYELLERNFEMQAANNDLLTEKNALLEDKIKTLEDNIQNLKGQLREAKAGGVPAGESVFYEGFVFKKQDGEYSEVPFCPNCGGIMGMQDQKRTFLCPGCTYSHRTQTLPSALVGELNRKDGLRPEGY